MYLGLTVSGAKGHAGGVPPLSRGRYVARLARSTAEVEGAQRLRHAAFWENRGRPRADGLDRDPFDQTAGHMLILDGASGELVACYRMQVFDGGTVAHSYAAQFYDLSPLCHFDGAMLELGRFCLHPARHDPDILRLAWASMTRVVDEAGIGLLFGCSSFAGADPARHRGALADLARHIAPARWRPGPLAPDRVGLCDLPADAAGQAAQMPPLLRTYLSMGGWVSDHAVIDRALDTLHVLTGVEIAAIPPARARALRLLAADCMG